MMVSRFLDRALRPLMLAIVVAMMLLTFVDVVGREVFASPLSSAPELTAIGLAALVYLGLPRVVARREHITVSLLAALFRGRVDDVRAILVSLLMVALCAILAWRLWIHGQHLGAEVMMFLDFRKALLSYGMSVLAAIAALVHLLQAGERLHAALRPSAIPDRADGEAAR